MKSSPQSLGGQVMAIRQRKEALQRYYENPNLCKNCNNIIPVPEKGKVRDARIKKFCNRSCAATYNNKIKPKRTKSKKSKRSKSNEVHRKPRATPLDQYLDEISVANKTKGFLFKNRTNWQSARSAIQKHARKVFFTHNNEVKCQYCSYSNHIDVCHIKPVSSFDDSTLISEINDVKNLLGLCKNHHWEFDHGILLLEEIQK